MDADALIQNEKANILDCLSATSDLALLAKNFYNTGVMVMRNNDVIQSLWNEVWDAGPISEICPTVDPRLTAMLTAPSCKLKINNITSKWNYFDKYKQGRRDTDCEKREANIVAWHGQERSIALREMREILKTKGAA